MTSGWHSTLWKLCRIHDIVGFSLLRTTLSSTSNSPHGLALKMSPQNPSANQVLEVAPLFTIGNFPMQNFPIENFSIGTFLFLAPLPYYREFSYREFVVINFHSACSILLLIALLGQRLRWWRQSVASGCSQVPKTPAPVQLKKWRRQFVGGEFAVAAASHNEVLIFRKYLWAI